MSSDEQDVRWAWRKLNEGIPPPGTTMVTMNVTERERDDFIARREAVQEEIRIKDEEDRIFLEKTTVLPARTWNKLYKGVKVTYAIKEGTMEEEMVQYPQGGKRSDAHKPPYGLMDVGALTKAWVTDSLVRKVLKLIGKFQYETDRDKSIKLVEKMLDKVLKSNLDLLDESMHVLKRGADKYEKYNWTLGMPFSVMIGSLVRHLMAINDVDNWTDVDEDSGRSHGAHVVVNILFLLSYINRGAGEDDRPGYYVRDHGKAPIEGWDK